MASSRAANTGNIHNTDRGCIGASFQSEFYYPNASRPKDANAKDSSTIALFLLFLFSLLRSPNNF
jgi:hypothetical protein